jgi:uncharacterized membrane protein
MTSRTILLSFHIVFVAAWLGANVVQLLLSPRFDKVGGAGNLEWNRQIEWLGKRFYAVVGMLVLLTGVGLVLLESTPWEWSDGFVGLGIGVVVLAAILGAAVFSPLQAKRIAAIESGDTTAARQLMGRIVAFGVFDSALVVLTILAMVHKWAA